MFIVAWKQSLKIRVGARIPRLTAPITGTGGEKCAPTKDHQRRAKFKRPDAAV